MAVLIQDSQHPHRVMAAWTNVISSAVWVDTAAWTSVLHTASNETLLGVISNIGS